MPEPTAPARRTWRVSLVALVALLAAGLAVLSPPRASGADAGSFAPPIVDIPRCYPRTFGPTIDCPTDLRNNGWGAAGTTTVTGTASPGETYTVDFSPRVPPCQWSSESGCYTSLRTYAPGYLYYLGYGASLSTQRLATNMTGTMSSEDTDSWSPGWGICQADWNLVYADGYKFAERAAAAAHCSLEFRYTKADGTQAHLDRLLGPTWVRVSSSITVCDAATSGGCTQSHGEGYETLVRLDGDLWPGPVATCSASTQSGPNGSYLRFDGSSTVDSELDSVRTWAFDPAGVTVTTNNGYSSHGSSASVTGAPPGTLKATYLLQTWQGSSEKTCTATVPTGTPTPTPSPTPSPSPSPTPTTAPTETPTPPPAPSCGLSGKPAVKGAARVGTTVKVKAPGWSVGGADVTYAWKVDGAKAGKDAPRLRLTEAMRGDKVTVTVTATAPACEPQKAVLRLGKVAAR